SPFPPDSAFHNYINNFLSERGNYLYFDFIAGSLVYVFRYQIPYSRELAFASAGLVLVNGLGLLPLGVMKPMVLALPFGYIIAFLGLQPIPKIPLYSRGDYSYGIYLYAY